jgi:hypothetical protein
VHSRLDAGYALFSWRCAKRLALTPLAFEARTMLDHSPQ